MDAISQTRIGGAAPVFVSRAMQLDKILTAQGITFRWTDVDRSFAQQDTDYKIGRDPSGKIIGTTITNAKAGRSWHQYSACGDGCPMVAGVPDWDVKGPNWQKIYAVLPTVGFRSGRDFKSIKGDNDHIQPIELPDSPTEDDLILLQHAGKQAVWAKYYLVEA